MTTKIIILAAGQGKRMNNPELPKVLVPLRDKFLISYVLEAIAASEVDDRPVIVVGQKAEQVKEALGDGYEYAFQAEQLGTGHAVKSAYETLKDFQGNIMVLYGDMPLISASTIKNLADTHETSGGALTMATVTVPDFDEWRAGFYDFGRIIRGEDGNVVSIIEKRDATPEQLIMTEVNPGYYCFKSEWLWQQLEQLKNENSQGEYYLTDMVDLAHRGGEKITTVAMEPKEALGINTVEQLALVEKFL